MFRLRFSARYEREATKLAQKYNLALDAIKLAYLRSQSEDDDPSAKLSAIVTQMVS